MWDDFTPEEIAGEDKTIDKIRLIRDFLDDDHCNAIMLTNAESLSIFLRKEIQFNSSGVYCICNNEMKEVAMSERAKV